jgi:hypothetical protein
MGENQLLSRDMKTTQAAEYHQIANFLHSIEWRISYNVLQGHSQDSIEFRSCIPGAEADEEGNLPNYGEFTLTSAPLSGNQETVIQWRSDEGQVTYFLISVSHPL